MMLRKLFFFTEKKILPLPNINKKQSQVEKWPKWEKQSYKAFGRQYRKKNVHNLRIH